jgi:hypothetical protein
VVRQSHFCNRRHGDPTIVTPQVIDMKANYSLIHECRRPALMVMDYDKDGMVYVNRCCITCDYHWYGAVGSVKEYTSKEWGAWLETPDAATPDSEQGGERDD